MTVQDQLPTTYEPTQVETEIAAFWTQGDYFHADPTSDARAAYTIVIPPPNVTGALHGGHALNNTLQDVLIRWHRMRGLNTLWMPGTDHAGIATQAVVERTVFETEGKTRHDLGRDEMVRRIWEWKETYGNRIINQLERMGCSCDWKRTRFTLDDVCARAVRHTFFRLFRDGLIVRGKRLVNWDTQLQTAVADDEVYHETVRGHLWHIRYPLKQPLVVQRDGREVQVSFLVVATTRPETMLGDTAVAVHPEDERWQPLLGKSVVLPLLHREIPVVADPILVDREFGSGCVKVTPAHDPNDYACGQRNDLAMVNILNPDGTINENGGPYAGMDRYEARRKIVADLEEEGLIERIEDHEADVGHSDRSKSPIEPYLSDQWFIQMGDLKSEEASRIVSTHMKHYLDGAKEPRASARAVPDPENAPIAEKLPGLAQLAMDMVCEQEHASAEQRKACGKVHFFPARYAKTYLDWLSEKRDWCISRQLWWGHRIPVWHRRLHLKGEDAWEQIVSLSIDHAVLGEMPNVSARIIEAETGHDRSAELKRLSIRTAQDGQLVYELDLGSLGDEGLDAEFDVYICVDQDAEGKYWDKRGFSRDPDVLDTWFSSALWPHSTLGWPEDTPQLRTYYPTSVLSTAREIITLWVARMVLTGMYNLGKAPFHDVYIHAVIQDAEGRPFKKTLGNGFDPVDIIEVYGADALRYTMASITTETQDIRMPIKTVKLEDGRELATSERFEVGRNFCNKVWNAARFAFMTLEGSESATIEPARLPIEDRWILTQVHRAAVEVQDALAHFQFARAINTARDFFWDALCDWYLELVKSRVREGRQAAEAQQVLAFALDQSLRLLHPFIPYLTERLWRQLNEIAPHRGLPGVAELDAGPALIVAAYPPTDGWTALNDPSAEAVFEDLQRATRGIREIRQARNVPPKTRVDVTIKVPADRVESMRHEAHVIRHLAGVGALTVDADPPRPSNAATLVVGDMQIYVADVIDPAAERDRLDKELTALDKQIGSVMTKLSNENFTARAPAEVVQRERDRLIELKDKRDTVVRAMEELAS